MRLPGGRWRFLLPLLALAASLAVFGDKTPPGAAKAVAGTPVRTATVAVSVAPSPSTRAATAVSTTAPAGEALEALRLRAELVQTAPGAMADLFASPRWSQPPPPPAPVVQAAPPVVIAPPAYRVLGKKKEEGGEWELYLGRDDSSFVVRSGDTLEGTWKVGKIEPPMVPMTHIQTGTVHEMPVGDSR